MCLGTHACLWLCRRLVGITLTTFPRRRFAFGTRHPLSHQWILAHESCLSVAWIRDWFTYLLLLAPSRFSLCCKVVWGRRDLIGQTDAS